MKNTIFYLLLSILTSIGLAGCQQLEDRAANIPIVKTCEAENITATTATIYGEVESLYACYCFYYFLISEDSTFPDDKCIKFYYEEDAPQESGIYTAELDELTPKTTYYYVMCATDGVAEVRGDVMSFTTTENNVARVGDYYYTDGTWSATLNNNKEVIGVVFALSEEKFGAINPSLKESNHGRIVELNDIYAGEKYPWATSNIEDVVSIPNFSLLDGVHSAGELPWNGQPTTNETLPYGMLEWLTNTGEQYALTDYNGFNYIKAPSECTAIRTAFSEQSWGYWYLPALGELARLGMACAAGYIPKDVQLAGYDYWSSTERDAATVWVYRVSAGNNHNHIVERYEKNNESMYCRIRRVACF